MSVLTESVATSPPGPPAVPVWAADLALAGVTLVWGFTFPVVKSALRDASPLCFNAVRLTLAAGLLALLYRPRLAGINRATWLGGAWLGLCLAAGYALQTAGLAATTPAKSAFITGFSVILVPILMALVWRRRPSVGAWAGTAAALAGLYLLVFAPGASASPTSLGVLASHRGEWLTLACAVAFALHIASLGELAPMHPFRHLAVLQLGFAGAFTWLLLPLGGVPRFHPSPAMLAALAVTAVLATAVAFTVQSWAQQYTPATHTAVIFALEPVFGWLGSAWLWHERLRPVQIAGAMVILAAIGAVELTKPGR